MFFIKAITSAIMVTVGVTVSKFSWDKYKTIYNNIQLNEKSTSIINLMIFIISASVTYTSKMIWEKYKKCPNLNEKSIINFKRKYSEFNSPNNECIMEILFFTEDSVLCRMHLNSNKYCEKLDCPVANLNKLTKYLNSAKHSIHVCMYLFTSQILGKAILAAKKRGILVKIILDASENVSEHSQILSFRRACIKVRTRNSNSLMHHKFVIIDNNILITGSANWTMQALFGNAENIIVTNHPILVKRFVDEFENLWKVYDNESKGTASLQLNSVKG